MGGSTGTVGPVVGAPASSLGEDARQTQQDVGGFSGLESGVRQTSGRITEVHEEKPVIKAYTDKGVPLGNGGWIPLNHSVADIAERWGKLRRKLRVLVSYSGPDGRGANATIIGEEDDTEGQGTQIENDINESLYEIFSPGSSPV
jgi:hypothetical protein